MEGEHGNLTLVHTYTYIFIGTSCNLKTFYLWEKIPLKKVSKSQWILNIAEKNVRPNLKKIGQIFQPQECVHIYALLVIWIKLKSKIYKFREILSDSNIVNSNKEHQ